MTFDEAKPQVEEEVCYECPIYQTLQRSNPGIGMGNNFITMVKTPLGLTEKTIPATQKRPEHWIKRGAAMVC